MTESIQRALPVEARPFVRRSSVASSMIARFPFATLRVGEAFFVPDRRTQHGRRTSIPVAAANRKLSPAVFKVRDEVNAEGVAGRYVYRVA